MSDDEWARQAVRSLIRRCVLTLLADLERQSAALKLRMKR